MTEVLVASAWLGGLLVAILAAEGLVRFLTLLGKRFHFTAALLGLLVALGADGPEVTSALAAAIQGKRQIGLGVVLGSNIYNLAGLLGLSAVLAAYVVARHRFIGPSEGLNIVVCLLLVAALFVPAAHTVFGLVLVVGIVVYGIVISLHSSSARSQPSAPSVTVADEDMPPRTRLVVLGVCAATILIIVGSGVVVNSSIYLGPRLGISEAVTGTFILAIATSIPNTWAAISLARHHMPAEAIATTFNSNSINIAIGIGAPSIAMALRESMNLMVFDVAWLLAMTTAAIVMLALRPALSRWEGSVLIGLYLAFVGIRLTAF